MTPRFGTGEDGGGGVLSVVRFRVACLEVVPVLRII